MNTSNNNKHSNPVNGISEPKAAEPLAAESLDPQQTTEETSALAAHLQRAGVMWLPPPDEHAIAQIATRFPAHGTKPIIPAVPDASQLSSGAAPSNAETQKPASNMLAQSGGNGPTKGITESESTPTQKHSTSNRPSAVRPASRLQGVPAIQTTESEYSDDPQPTDQRILELEQLAQAVASCTLCPALASCRHKTVFGEGNPNPRFAFFGEGPGQEEDLSGQPFVGKAGELLTKMMQACTLKRNEVYILNTVKCRPPGNRNPEGEELSNCRTYYQQQLEILRPEYIVCLGAVSAQELLGTKLSVGRLRGTLHRHFASKVLVTYHPAYLLRNPAAKKAAWADLQYLMRDAGIQIPKP